MISLMINRVYWWYFYMYNDKYILLSISYTYNPEGIVNWQQLKGL